MPRRFLLAVLLVLSSIPARSFGMTPEERRAYRDHLLSILPKPDNARFDDWLKKYDELPPDFDALPRNNALPDPLKFADGRPVTTPEEWRARRTEILALFQKYVFGTIPPHPKLDHADVTDTPGQGFTTRTVVLHVGPEGKGTMHMTMTIPEGKGPFPVIMSPGGGGGGGRGGPPRGGPGGAPGGPPGAVPGAIPPAGRAPNGPGANGANDLEPLYFVAGPAAPGGPGGGRAGGAPGAARGGGPGRGPNQGAIARTHGYINVTFTASDGADDSINIGALYPQGVNDPGDLPRRGWSATCVLDYLETVPEVDMKKVAIFGYSRDGKMITIAAALDERISAIYAGSAGVGGVLAYRNAGERNMAESIQSTTSMFPSWFNGRLRFFTGREDRLPVDGNLLLAALAPRPFVLISGLNDEVSNDWGDEQSIHSAQKVYDLLGAPNKMALLRVPGYHGANDLEAGFKFLDFQFGKAEQAWTTKFMFPWDFQQWKKANGSKVEVSSLIPRNPYNVLASANGAISTSAAWETRAADVRKSIEQMLGDMTPVANAPPAPAPAATPDVPAWIIGRSVTAQGGQGLLEFGWYAQQYNQAATRNITFGNNIKGTLYYPKSATPGTKLPTVIWLHSYSYPLGYMWVYHREVHPIIALVEAGYAVFAYDQAGFGSRMAEAANFYDRMPNGSMMGQMVADARLAIDALAKDPSVDAQRISLFGYAMGGNVALYTAALDPRVQGVVSIAGFTPMRTDTADKGTGGIARFAVEHPLIPRLGLFIGQEAKLPYDYDDMIAAIAPRPVCVLSPTYDRDATPADVKMAVEAARKAYALYNAADKLKLDEPWDYNRLSNETQARLIQWMKETLK